MYIDSLHHICVSVHALKETETMTIEINLNNNSSRCQKLTVNCLSPYFQALCISVCLNLRNASPLNVNHVSFFPLHQNRSHVVSMGWKRSYLLLAATEFNSKTNCRSSFRCWACLPTCLPLKQLSFVFLL